MFRSFMQLTNLRHLQLVTYLRPDLGLHRFVYDQLHICPKLLHALLCDKRAEMSLYEFNKGSKVVYEVSTLPCCNIILCMLHSLWAQ